MVESLVLAAKLINHCLRDLRIAALDHSLRDTLEELGLRFLILLGAVVVGKMMPASQDTPLTEPSEPTPPPPPSLVVPGSKDEAQFVANVMADLTFRSPLK